MKGSFHIQEFSLAEKRFQLRFLNVASNFCSKNTCIENKSIQLRTTRPLPFQDLNASHHLVAKRMSHTTKVGFFSSPGFPSILATEQEKRGKKSSDGLEDPQSAMTQGGKEKEKLSLPLFSSGIPAPPTAFSHIPSKWESILARIRRGRKKVFP